MGQRQAPRPSSPAPLGTVAISIGEALVFLQREAARAGLAELADSLAQPIHTAAKLSATG